MAFFRSKRFKLIAICFFCILLVIIRSALLVTMGFFLIGAMAGTLGNTITDVSHRYLSLFLFMLPLAILVYLILYVQFFKLPPPREVTLLSPDYRAQYDKIKQICRALACPEIHRIYFDSSMDITISEYARMGHLLGRKLSITIGIPLMLALSEREFLALAAQRCACYSRKHEKDACYAYRSMRRMRAVFQWMDDRFEASRYDSAMLLGLFPMLNTFLPALETLYYETKESHILLSDQLAAGLIGKDALISALIRKHGHKRAGTLDQFWQDTYNYETPNLPVHIYRSLELWMLRDLPEDHVTLTNHQPPTLPLYQRPTLSTRLLALGYDNTPIPPVKLNALSQFMPGESNALLDYLGRIWEGNNRQQWKEQYDNLALCRQRFQDLVQKHNNGRMDGQDYLELKKLAMQAKLVDAALELLQPSLEHHPGSEYLISAIGQLMLAKDDPAGVALLEQVAYDKKLMVIRYVQVMNHYIKTQQYELARVCYRNGVTLVSRDGDCYSERQSVRPDEKPVNPVFVYNERDSIIKSLQSIPHIEKVYAAGRLLADCPYFPMYIIGLQFTKGTGTEQINAILKRVRASGMIPWDYHIVVLNRKNSRALASKLALLDCVRLK